MNVILGTILVLAGAGLAFFGVRTAAVAGDGAAPFDDLLGSGGVAASGTLDRSGSTSSVPVSRIAESVVTAVVGATVGFALGRLLGADTMAAVLVAALLAAVGAAAPTSLAERRTRRRLAEIDRSVVEMANLLAVTVRAGLGIEAAFEAVTSELEGPIRDELQRFNDEIRSGLTRREALARLRERVPTPDMNRFAQALQHTEELGGSVNATLTALAEDCRTRRFQQAREEAAKLPVKILFPVVFLTFPPMLIVLVGPAASEIARAFGS